MKKEETINSGDSKVAQTYLDIDTQAKVRMIIFPTTNCILHTLKYESKCYIMLMYKHTFFLFFFVFVLFLFKASILRIAKITKCLLQLSYMILLNTLKDHYENILYKVKKNNLVFILGLFYHHLDPRLTSSFTSIKKKAEVDFKCIRFFIDQ